MSPSFPMVKVHEHSLEDFKGELCHINPPELLSLSLPEERNTSPLFPEGYVACWLDYAVCYATLTHSGPLFGEQTLTMQKKALWVKKERKEEAQCASRNNKVLRLTETPQHGIHPVPKPPACFPWPASERRTTMVPPAQECRPVVETRPKPNTATGPTALPIFSFFSLSGERSSGADRIVSGTTPALVRAHCGEHTGTMATRRGHNYSFVRGANTGMETEVCYRGIPA